MKLQLTLQFTATSNDFDECIAFEERLIQALPPDHEVDGHDFGSNEFNIFIWTARPIDAFNAVLALAKDSLLWEKLRAAGYRKRGADDYVILWPEQVEHFRVI